MKNSDSFLHLLNGIFREFSAAAMISLQYTRSMLPDRAQPAVPRLLAVNGYASFKAFASFLLHLRASLLDEVVTSLADLDATGKHQFLQQAVRAARALTRCTVSGPGGSPVSRIPVLREIFFAKPSFLLDGAVHQPPEEVRKELLWQSRWHAWYWQLTVEALVSELSSFLYQVHFLPVIRQPGKGPVRDRIPVKTSVQTLAAFGRLLFDNRAFDLNNKEKFCRLVADCFCTIRQKNISPGSLRNHFDAPTPETLSLLMAEMRKMMQNSQRLRRVN